MKKFKLGVLIISIIICLSIGFLGSIFTSSSVNSWYPTIKKPSFNPPSWIFGPVWTVLYILMGISVYLFWLNSKNPDYLVRGLILFVVHLILNFAWSFLFFGLQNPLLALIEIVVLWLSIIFVIFYFYKVSKTSSYLLIPYLLWVTFASILNLFIVILN